MALPKLSPEEVTFKPVKLPSGRKIGIREWKVREEKELLFATEGVDDKEKVKTEIVKMVRKCVDNQQLFDGLSETDILAISMELRKISKGESVEFSFTCPHCEKTNPGELSLAEDLKVKHFDAKPIKIGELTFAIKEVPYTVKNQLKRDYVKTAEYNYHYLVDSIDSVTHNGKAYATFTRDEMMEFVDDLDPKVFKKLYDSLDGKVATISLQSTSVCLFCQKEIKVVFEDLYDFFVS